MMRLTLACIGRLKNGPEREICDRYQKRLQSAARQLAIGPLDLIEHPEAQESSTEERKRTEAKRLLKSISLDSATTLIALDETGKQLASTDFAAFIKNKRDDGASRLVFAIGGPDGHGTDLLAAASHTLSLSKMTLPHGLARIHLIEQIYRATTILSGHPYHRV